MHMSKDILLLALLCSYTAIVNINLGKRSFVMISTSVHEARHLLCCSGPQCSQTLAAEYSCTTYPQGKSWFPHTFLKRRTTTRRHHWPTRRRLTVSSNACWMQPSCKTIVAIASVTFAQQLFSVDDGVDIDTSQRSDCLDALGLR